MKIMKKSSSCNRSMKSRIKDKSKLFKPGPFDVICGNMTREANFHHVGNRRFRLLVENHVLTYERAETRSEKATVVSSILSSIQAAGGGFVLRCCRTPQQSDDDDDDDDDDKAQCWELLGRRQQREKVGQCLRAAIQAKSDSAASGLSSNRLYDVIGVQPTSFKAHSTPNTSAKDETPESLIAAIASSMRPQIFPQETNRSISRSPVLSIQHNDSITAGGMEGALPPVTTSRHHTSPVSSFITPVISDTKGNGIVVLQTGDSRNRLCAEERNPKEAANISTTSLASWPSLAFPAKLVSDTKTDRSSSSTNGSQTFESKKKQQHENQDTIVLEQLLNDTLHNGSLSVGECAALVDHHGDVHDTSSKMETSCEQLLSRRFSFVSFPLDGDPVDEGRNVGQDSSSTIVQL